MSNIQGWAMQLCVVCILVTVILSFIKNEKVNNSIKTVLALYILLTAMALPLGKDAFPDDIDDFEQESISPVNAQAFVKQNAQKALISQINAELESASLNAVCVDVLLNEDLTQALSVIISANDNEKQAAQEIAQKMLGNNDELIFEFKG